MRLSITDFETEKGRLVWLFVSGLLEKLEYPNCEGEADKKRIIKDWEEVLGKISL